MPVQLIQEPSSRESGDKYVVVRGNKPANIPVLPVLLVGVGAPIASLGSVGDGYLDLSTGEVYGARGISGWGSPIYTLSGA